MSKGVKERTFSEATFIYLCNIRENTRKNEIYKGSNKICAKATHQKR
jgi:hypothetical protein